MRLSPGLLPAVFRTARPLVFAHRGGAKLLPENTMAAFDNGLAMGADGLELDVHLSADGIPVVIHDKTLDRTTDRQGPVSSLTAAALAAVDAGYRFGADRGFPFRGRGLGVPRLDDVVARHTSARMIIEMKDGDPALARAVIDVVRRMDAGDRVCLGSFYPSAVAAARQLDPGLATTASQPETKWALYRSWVRWPVTRPRPYVAFQVPERAGRMRVVSRTFVRQAHKEGQVVQVWVIDAIDDATRLFDWGVDGVISDRPDAVVPARDAWAAKTLTPRLQDLKTPGPQDP